MNNRICVIGIDSSLNGFSATVLNINVDKYMDFTLVENIYFTNVKRIANLQNELFTGYHIGKISKGERLNIVGCALDNLILEINNSNDIPSILYGAIEDYATGKAGSGSRVFEIGEMAGVAKQRMKANSINYICPGIAHIKMVLGKNGASSKNEVKNSVQAILNRRGVNIDLNDYGEDAEKHTSGNICDSFGAAIVCALKIWGSNIDHQKIKYKARNFINRKIGKDQKTILQWDFI